MLDFCVCALVKSEIGRKLACKLFSLIFSTCVYNTVHERITCVRKCLHDEQFELKVVYCVSNARIMIFRMFLVPVHCKVEFVPSDV